MQTNAVSCRRPTLWHVKARGQSSDASREAEARRRSACSQDAACVGSIAYNAMLTHFFGGVLRAGFCDPELVGFRDPELAGFRYPELAGFRDPEDCGLFFAPCPGDLFFCC